MITKYMTRDNLYGELITAIDVEKETEKSVWINGRREAKHSSWATYHDTWEEAKTYLLALSLRKLKNARRSLLLAQTDHGNVKGLKEP